LKVLILAFNQTNTLLHRCGARAPKHGSLPQV
jgi:hypothetical protein